MFNLSGVTAPVSCEKFGGNQVYLTKILENGKRKTTKGTVKVIR